MIKCVITAAGYGTRLQPITKIIPKEMLPVFKYQKNNPQVIPLLQLIFEQLYSQKIRDFCFIIRNDKKIIKDYFDSNNFTLNKKIKQHNNSIDFYKKIMKSKINFINQNKPLGFGDAVKKSQKFVGKNNFFVHAGDAAIFSPFQHPIKRMIKLGQTNPDISGILLLKKIKDPKRYGVPQIQKISNSIFKINEVEEKPETPKSRYGILPLYYFTPSIFDALRKIKPGRGNEYQLTDGIQKLIESGNKILGIPLKDKEIEIDVGTPETFAHAQKFTFKNKYSI